MKEDTMFNDFRDLFQKIKKNYTNEFKKVGSKNTCIRLVILTMYNLTVFTLSLVVIPVTHFVLYIIKR